MRYGLCAATLWWRSACCGADVDGLSARLATQLFGDASPVGLKFRSPASARAQFDLNIRSAVKEAGEIEVLGEIGESFWTDNFTTAKMVKDRLKEIGANNPVLVTINSPGGSAFEGVAIYNILREHKGDVTCNVIGMAASAASIIAMAGDVIKVGEAAMMMIHSASGVVVGNQEDMREFADVLDTIDKSVAALYSSRTGLSEAECLDMMQAETWMTAADAVAKGFADVAIKDKKPKPAMASAESLAAIQSRALAASGDQRPVVRLSATPPPGASGLPVKTTIPKGANMKTIQEQITALENKRAAGVARREAIQQKAIADGRTKDEAERQEFATLSSEIEAIDAELVDLRLMEKQAVAAGTAVTVVAAAGDVQQAGTAARGGVDTTGIVSVRNNLKPGQAMGRYAMALYQGGGNPQQALSVVRARRDWMDTTPGLEKVLMTAVATGDTTTAGWASELVYAQNLQNEFIEYLRPMTIVGKLTALRQVPFNVRMGSQTAGSSANWVGQAKPIPVSKLTTSSVSLGITKMAGLVTVDDELMRSSSPSAELLVRDDLAETISVFMDTSFIDPNQGGQTNIQPASMTYGLTPQTPSGTTAAALQADVATLFSTAIAANLNPSSGTWVMSPTTALKLSLMLTSLGQQQYPTISINGGTLFGMPVIVSQSAKIAGSPQYGEMIVLLFQREIFLADDGQVTIAISNEASLELKDNPTNSGSGGETATSMVSMYQTVSSAIRAVRYVNWTKRRSQAAAFIQAANYG